MQVFELVKNKLAADFWLEDQAFEGVKRVAGKAAGDVEKVTGVLPVVQTLDGTETTAFLQEISESETSLSSTREDAIVFAATVGHIICGKFETGQGSIQFSVRAKCAFYFGQ